MEGAIALGLHPRVVRITHGQRFYFAIENLAESLKYTDQIRQLSPKHQERLARSLAYGIVSFAQVFHGDRNAMRDFKENYPITFDIGFDKYVQLEEARNQTELPLIKTAVSNLPVAESMVIGSLLIGVLRLFSIADDARDAVQGRHREQGYQLITNFLADAFTNPDARYFAAWLDAVEDKEKQYLLLGEFSYWGLKAFITQNLDKVPEDHPKRKLWERATLLCTELTKAWDNPVQGRS